MQTNQLIYASTANKSMSYDEISDLAKKASQKNETLGLTGFLVYNNNHFLQVLEGPQSTLNELYLKISNDPRHSDVRLLNYSKIAFRHFKEWNMGCMFLETQPKIKKIVNEYFKYGEFTPYNLSPEVSNLFMNEVYQCYKNSLYFMVNNQTSA